MSLKKRIENLNKKLRHTLRDDEIDWELWNSSEDELLFIGWEDVDKEIEEKNKKVYNENDGTT